MKEKSKGGRPKIAEQKKSKHEVKCYLTYSEKLSFNLYKKQHKLGNSEVVRSAVLQYLKLAPKRTKKLSPETLEIIREVERTNHTLNQIAKLLNTGLQLDGAETVQFFKIITNLENNTKQIINKLEQ